MKYQTDITVVLDRSGSMSSIKHDVEGGFQTFLDEQKAHTGSARISLVQFDNVYDKVYTDVNIQEAPRLTLEPRGATALYGAVGRAIKETGDRLSMMDEKDRPSQILFLVITDGQHNVDNPMFPFEKVSEMIKHQKEKYSWQFVFIGVNELALQETDNFKHFAGVGNCMDKETLTSGGILSTPGEYVVNALQLASRGTTSYRTKKVAQVDNYFDQKGG